MAKLVDARDLKSRGSNILYRFDPGFRHHSRVGSIPKTIYRGVEQLVARRAHNPKVAWFKSRLRNQKRFHSRYNFGYGILLYILKMPYFRPFTAAFGGFEGDFCFRYDKSAILCPGKTELADFVSFKGSIVQGIKK